ncbi:hypothetical protein FQN52_003414 [Onygenales sp. PD_12]|nr:hypothetical protein FQN52_003414 [Onygenales sp. PD_12]
MPSASFEKSVKGATKTKVSAPAVAHLHLPPPLFLSIHPPSPFYNEDKTRRSTLTHTNSPITKQNAAPKSKYIEHILTATYSEAGVAEIFRTLQYRLRDSTWTIVFKSLIVIHMMVREGSAGAALKYLSQNPRKLAITSISEVQAQGANIWRYSEYLISRSSAYAETRTDYVRGGQGRLKRLTVNKGLLRETEIVQKQIHALLKCGVLMDDPENEINLTAFRLLTLDLLTLYSVMNEGTINVLEHYFEMSRPDSERALKIYKRFSAQTEEVVRFLRIARQFESATRLEIPNLKHASTDLTKLLEDDLNDPDFAQRRREYRAEKFGTKSEKAENGVTRSRSTSAPQKQTSKPTTVQPTAPKIEVGGSGPDLLGLLDDPIQPAQQPIGQQQFNPQNNMQFQQQQFQQMGFQPQQTGFVQQNNFQQPQQLMQPGLNQQQTGYGGQSNPNPFGQTQPQPQLQPLQPDHTGAGFGGYTPQPQQHNFQTPLPSIPQNGVASFQQPMHTGGGRPNNPFRQSMLPPPDNMNLTSPPPASPLTRQNTNPFAKRLTMQQIPQFTTGGPSPFSSQPPAQTQTPPPLQPQRTGTNPFSRPQTAPGLQPPAAAPLRPNPTGSTNPFRQSQFINQNTGQGWQAGGVQGTMGGLENLETVPVFPRPGQMA